MSYEEMPYEKPKVNRCVLLTVVLLFAVVTGGVFVFAAAISMRHATSEQWFVCEIFNHAATGSLIGGVFSILIAIGVGACATRGSIRKGYCGGGPKKDWIAERNAHDPPLNTQEDFSTDEEENGAKKKGLLRGLILPGVANCGLFLWAALLLTVGVLLSLFVSWTKDLPSLTQDFTSVPGVKGPISIMRDESGITHIIATDQLDAVFGQGFAHGQDRLWQIEFQRLAYKGQLAMHLGKVAEKFDKQTRTLNFPNAAKILCDNISPEEEDLFTAYVDGLNYYLSSNKNRPPEFLFMSQGLIGYHEPEPFEVVDVCGAARLLQWKLSLNVNREIDRFKIFWETDADYSVLENLYTNFTNASSTILSAQDLNITGEDMIEQRRRERETKDVERELYSAEGYMGQLRAKYNPSRGQTMKPLAHLTHRGMETQEHGSGGSEKKESSSCSFFGGDEDEEDDSQLDIVKWIRDHASNAWVGKGEGLHAKSCQASDPHLELNAPAIWYYTHLNWGSFDVAGTGMLGIPGVHIGKTSNVSWGITMSMTDLEDLFLLVPSASKPETHYMHNGVEVAYTMRTETIKVKGKDSPVVLTVKDSLYGPVSTEILGLPRPDVLNFAARARALQPDNTSITAIFNMINPEVDTAKKVRDMIFANLQSPGFSIPCTDAQGEMVYTMTGKHVIRAFGHTGWIPTIGNGTFDWVGSIPFEELPTKVIPAREQRGAISAANQKIYPDGYKYILGLDFVYPYRGKRLQQLVNTSLSMLSNLSYHVEIQTDIRSNMWAQLFRPLLNSSDGRVEKPDDGPELPVALPAPFVQHLTVEGKTWLRRLMEWDGHSTKGTVEPTFFWFWYRTLGRYPVPAISALKKHYWSDHQYPYYSMASPSNLTEQDCRNFYADHPDASPSMPADKSTPCFWLGIDSFNMLAKSYADPSSLPIWGEDINRINAFNLMMSKTPLKCMFDIKAGKDGDHTSIDVADYKTLAGKIPIIAASSMRQVYSWATPDWIHFALPGGESGNPFSPRYRNLMTPYIEDKYQNVTVVGVSSVKIQTLQDLTP